MTKTPVFQTTTTVSPLPIMAVRQQVPWPATMSSNDAGWKIVEWRTTSAIWRGEEFSLEWKLSQFSSLGAWWKGKYLENKFYRHPCLDTCIYINLFTCDWRRLENVPVCFRRSRRYMRWVVARCRREFSLPATVVRRDWNSFQTSNWIWRTFLRTRIWAGSGYVWFTDWYKITYQYSTPYAIVDYR